MPNQFQQLLSYGNNPSDTLPFSKQGPYTTQLDPASEWMFRQWLNTNRVNFDPMQMNPDYDMRGFFAGLMKGDPHAQTGVDPTDHKVHYNDYWKTPLEATFSDQSKYATPDAPYWKGDAYTFKDLLK